MGYLSLIIIGSSPRTKWVISGASPIFVFRYVAQHVFINSRDMSISSSRCWFQLGDFRATDSGSPLVAPSAMVPGMKQARWSILGNMGFVRPPGRSPRTMSFDSLENANRCLRIPCIDSSHMVLYMGSSCEVCRYCLMRYSKKKTTN